MVPVTDQPEYNSQSQGRTGQCGYETGCRLIEVENDESANQSQQSDQHDRSYLDDVAPMMPNDQQRVFKLEGNQYRKHHSKDGLEDLGIDRTAQTISAGYESERL